MIIEISKNICKREFNGNVTATIKAGYYNKWTAERIRGAFNCGSGTLEDLKRYMENNKTFCYFRTI